MAESIKVFQTGAFQLEAGKTGVGQSPGWGESGSEETLGANNAFPWLNFGKGMTVNDITDNSITSEAYQDVPRIIGKYVEKPLGMYARFAGMGSFNYWMWGFENSIVKVGVFVLTTPSVDPTPGDTYRDVDLNDYTFLRKEINQSTTYYVFRCDDNVVPTLATGNLDLVSGSGDDPLAFTAHSVLMYEHLYELDAHTRHFVDYLIAEQITGWASGDKKNRMATLGIKMGTNDFRYKNAMCRNFGFASNAGALAEINGDFLAYEEERGDYSSANWTFPSERNSSDNIVAHHQVMMQIGASESALTTLCVTAIDLSIGIPLQVLQDTCSGLYIAEPIMEGKYDIGLTTTISRHSVDTWQDYRDAWTSLVGRISANYGYYRQEYLVQEFKIPEAGPDDSDVASEPLTLKSGDPSGNNWSTWLYGNSLIQGGPIVMRVRDLDSTNHMFEI